jgi:hypothetical protein
MIIATKTGWLAILAFLFQMVFNCTALAHIETAKIFPSDGNNEDNFGVSVAIDGNFAVVGAYKNDSNGSDCGAAYVYELSGPYWLQRQKLTPSDGQANDRFGRSVAIEGNTIVVGSYYGDSNYQDTGSVYVYTRTGDAWTQQQKLIAPDAATDDRFGCSVAIDNNTIVIGNYNDDSQAGSASVFTSIGSTWSFQQKLTASDAYAGDFFGNSVAIDNNTIIIGAPYDDYPGNTDAGSAYLYQRQGTTWVEQYILRASDGGPSHHFGFSVALDGNWAVIGAYEGDADIVSGAGAAYVFNKTGSNWVEQQKLIDANSPVYGEDFGWSVAIKNDTILVGCPREHIDGNPAGAVFEFVRTGSTWVQNDRLTAGDADPNDGFGKSVALSGRHIIIGAPYNFDNGKSTGSAYLFDNFSGDLNGDFGVDFFDFAVLAGSWGQNNPLADIAPVPAGDDIVDIKDLAVLCDNWLAGK